MYFSYLSSVYICIHIYSSIYLPEHKKNAKNDKESSVFKKKLYHKCYISEHRIVQCHWWTNSAKWQMHVVLESLFFLFGRKDPPSVENTTSELWALQKWNPTNRLIANTLLVVKTKTIYRNTRKMHKTMETELSL